MFPPEPQSNFPGQPAAQPNPDWSAPEITLIFFLFLLPILITFHGLIHLPGLALAYLVLNIWIYQKICYKACTRCRHYGRACPTLGGKAATWLWSSQEGKLEGKERKLVRTLWVLMAVVPMAALLLTRRYFHLAGVIGSIAGFHLARARIGCRKCRKGEECPFSRISSRFVTGPASHHQP